MKSKTKTYLLLVLVLAIWGAIGYQIVSAVNPEKEKVVNQDFAIAFNPKAETEVDTFSIQTADRDPFLGTRLVKQTSKSTLSKLKQQPVVWKPITYHGNISNQNKKAVVYVISIEGSQYLMKIGQVVKNIKLIKGTSKHVQLRYKGKIKTITKT
ncbi:hypothetical protein [uncultured Algibacter sp.]|uniref:hypothetical protein n=1 Tax=uncultured Algibacter sp. TaxID=298659 RepID=UPI00263529F3|nr:hypothetical protein [uncultured Algibacter sp.]